MSKVIRLAHGYSEIVLTIKHRAPTQGKDVKVFNPTQATLDRYTALAQRYIDASNRPTNISFNLLTTDEGFGWELAIYEMAVCLTCGRGTEEFFRNEFEAGVCRHCKIEQAVEQALQARQAQKDNGGL